MSVKKFGGFGRIVSSAVFCALLIMGPSGANAAYLLQPGDTLEFTLVGSPELRQKIVIDPDGYVSLPLIEPVKAGGVSLRDLNQVVSNMYANKVIRQRITDGRTITTIVSPEDVALAVSEFRPIYSVGDVAAPGEIKYRPGVTVRQVIAMSGGLNAISSKKVDPLQVPVYQANLKSAMSEYIAAIADVWRANSELMRDPAEKEIEASASKLGIDAATLRNSIKTASERLQAQQSENVREKNYLRAVIDQTDKRLSALSDQKQREEEASRDDAKDYDRLSSLLEKGTTNVIRVTDARRIMLLSATRILQTEAAIAQARRDKEELKRKLDGYDDERRLKVVESLQKATQLAAAAKSRIEAARVQLQGLGTLRARDKDGSPLPPIISIYRGGAGDGSKIHAALGDNVMPGDTVEVEMCVDDVACGAGALLANKAQN